MEEEKDLNEVMREANERAKGKADKVRDEFSRKLHNLVYDENENKVKMETIASKLGISHQTLLNYVTGRKFPRLEQLILIKEHFDEVSGFDWLLSELPYEVTDKSDNLIQLGINPQAIKNLKRICQYANDWGFDENTDNINPIIFALNYLLTENNSLLYLIGDYLLLPTDDSLDFGGHSNNDKEQDFVYQDEMFKELYQQRIMKELDKIISNFRSSKKGKEVSENRKSVVEQLMNKNTSIENYFKEEQEKQQTEIEMINKTEIK